MSLLKTGRWMAVGLAMASGTAVTANAMDLLVPTGFASVQAAIDAAQPGDVIVLAPGQYSEQLQIVGRSLTIRGSTGNPADVQIGIQGGGTIVSITDSPNVKFQGLTLRGGQGSRGLICGSNGSITIFAGAVLGTFSGIELDQCIVRDNTADLGGAFFLSGGSLTIRRSTISDNGNVPSPGSTACVGAVLRTCDRVAPATILIEDSLITNNGDLSDGLDSISPYNGTLTVRRTRFENNYGAVIQPLGQTDVTVEASEFIGNGGVRPPITIALASGDVRLNVTGTRFENNEGDSAADIFVATPANTNSEIRIVDCDFINSQGSAVIYTPDQGGSAVIDRCEFRGSASIGLGIFASGGTTLVSNSLFAGSAGEGVFVANASEPATTTISNCTIVGSGNMGIRLDALLVGTLNVRNTIVTGNAFQQIGAPLIPIGQTISVERSIVQGGFPGAGNFDVNPLFVSGTGSTGDYRLQATSPAIDAGNNTLALANGIDTESVDLSGNARFADVASVPNTGTGTGAIIDIGAYEFVAAPACVADFDRNGSVQVADIFEFLNAWFQGEPSANINGGILEPSDIFDFLNAWFAGC